jgi:glucose/arabinose dehydrogenase
MKLKALLSFIVLAFVIAGVYLFVLRDKQEQVVDTPDPITDPLVPIKAPETVVTGLNIPWELVFLPNEDMLVTERPGRLLRIGDDKEVIEISGVAHRGEGGLLGLALDPKFGENGLIYLYLTTQDGGRITNRVERYKLVDATLSNREVIIENIPGASNHDGGRIAFAPPTSCESGRADCLLYVTTGDAGNENSAQDKNSLAGKILRLRPDGSVPADNPFDNAIYSYGHRNIQGIAWDSRGQLWATEHGRSGVLSGYDELNKIVKGGNYGWPVIQGSESQSGMISPQKHSGSSDTWAPAGMTYIENNLIFTGLRGESLYVSNISSGSASDLEKYLEGEYGRLRTIVPGPDGMLYILTNNRDGRGKPTNTDDRIIKIDSRSLMN